jgi:predicted RNase H-like HicB family nuclease
MTRDFYVMIEKDEDGLYVGEVPQLQACYAQGRTIDELLANMREVIELALADAPAADPAEFVGVQRLVLSV